jgi:hypothetical protein
MIGKRQCIRIARLEERMKGWYREGTTFPVVVRVPRLRN